MRNVSIVAMLLSILVLLPSSVLAQEEASDSEAKPSTNNFMMSFGTGMSPFQDVTGYNPFSINTRIGYFFTNQFALDLGLDFMRIAVSGDGGSTTSIDVGSDEGQKGDEGGFDEAYNFFTFHLGPKIYFFPRVAKKATIYSQTSLFFVIPSATSDSSYTEAVARDSYAIGLLEGIGAEYFFSDYFSVGGEFGINWIMLKLDDGDDQIKAKVFDLYNAFTLNFFF